jgi:SAM-dependent methyltransferase
MGLNIMALADRLVIRRNNIPEQKAIIDKMKKPQYVQYGCGLSAPINWENFDSSPTLRIEKLPLIGYLYSKKNPLFPQNVNYGDIVKGLPLLPLSCEAIYCSHVLEHLSLDDFRTALRHTNLVLKPGGVFRFVLPDLEYCVRQYMNDTSSEAASNFMKEAYLGSEFRERGFKSLAKSFFGNSLHLWMWDYKSIYPELESAGFLEIRRAEFADSSDVMFKYVEDEDRWANCLGIECRKAI